MKTLSESVARTNGKRRVVVELEPGEKLISVRDDAFYRLGNPLDDVIAGHILSDATRAQWCSVTQKWEV